MIEKELKRYVIANANTCEYLKVELRNKKYEYVNDIEAATKAADLFVANVMLNRFYEDTQVIERDMVVLPLVIKYELLDKIDNVEEQSNDIMSSWISNIGSAQSVTLPNGEECFIQFD